MRNFILIHRKLNQIVLINPVFYILAAFYTPFFKEVWEKKPEIEQAFNMEEPGNLNDSGEGTLEYSALHPMPPPRHESYHLQTPDDG